jgi:chromosome segregation ATPase
MNDSAVRPQARRIYKQINQPLLLLSVVAAMLLVSTVMLYIAKEAEKTEKANAQRRLSEALEARKTIEAKLREIENEAAGAKSSLKAQEEKIAALSKDLEEQKSASAKYAAAIKEKEAEIDCLKIRLAEAKAERDKLVGDLQRLNDEHVQLKFYFENIMKSKEEIDKKAKEIAEKQGISLGTIVIKQNSK